jgi:hypothetical protein
VLVVLDGSFRPDRLADRSWISCARSPAMACCRRGRAGSVKTRCAKQSPTSLFAQPWWRRCRAYRSPTSRRACRCRAAGTHPLRLSPIHPTPTATLPPGARQRLAGGQGAQASDTRGWRTSRSPPPTRCSASNARASDRAKARDPGRRSSSSLAGNGGAPEDDCNHNRAAASTLEIEDVGKDDLRH